MEWAAKKKLSNPKFNRVHIPTVAQDGKIREMLCMPIKKLNGWLFSINLKKLSLKSKMMLSLIKKNVLKLYIITGMK